jgi:ABC-type transporter Mla maintaining outer membrane lipid asymmetry ATPase subunit MlaF
METARLIEMEGVTVKAPGAGLTGIDWVVCAGESWAVTGLQGSGKTALLEVVVGLASPIRGEVRLFGQRMAEMSPSDLANVRQRMGVVFEGRGRLFPRMSVYENVALPLCYRGNLSMTEVLPTMGGLLERMGLEHVAEQSAGSLGYAWARRVALARALVMGPELLLVENPFAGLDAAHTRWWRRFLGELKQGSALPSLAPLTCVMTADDPRWILGLCDRFAVTHGGSWRSFSTRSDFERCAGAELRDLLHDTD